MSSRPKYRFRLYLAGEALNSAQARANLAAMCRTHLHERYEIDIVDVFVEPKRALADNIIMTPTLIKLAPGPVKRIIGSLSNAQTLSQALGLTGAAA